MLNLGPFDLLVPVIVILVAIIYIPITFITLLRKSIKSPQLRTWSAFQQAWFARFWDFFGWGSRWLFAPDIEAVLSQAHGVVLDVGTGSGDWLYLFSPERNKKISKLLLLEPNRYFHPTLRRRAQKLGLSDKYEILDGGVEDLERIGIQKGTIDTITTIHVLCSVHSPQTSIEKLYQYLKPGGRWLVYEHIRIKNKSKIAAAIQGGGVLEPLFYLFYIRANLQYQRASTRSGPSSSTIVHLLETPRTCSSIPVSGLQLIFGQDQTRDGSISFHTRLGFLSNDDDGEAWTPGQ